MDLDLDLRRLRYFVTVAEELSFTRAAGLLHLTQPALSRQIRLLEDELGAVLFTRDHRGTRLTAAGRQLLDGARPMLTTSTVLQQRVRAAGRGESRFVIGFMPGVDPTPIVREFTAAAPHVSVDVVHTSVTDQVDFLLDGRVDVCFVRLPLSSPSIAVLPLFEEPRAAALPSGHPLAKAATVSLDELGDLPLLPDPRDAPGAPRPPTIEESLERVAAGAGVFVLPAGLATHYHHRHVRYVALRGEPPCMIGLAYPTDRAMPELEQFAKIAVRQLHGAGV